MRNKSHAAMGRYLLCWYMPGLPRRYARVFLLGCTEPDKNPVTYLKGSLRAQWLRGHNYPNARRYILRLANRLSGKPRFTYWDYYSLGKLTHYVLDAFTLAHNETFPTKLRSHRCYERKLQRCFLTRLSRMEPPPPQWQGSVAELIHKMHADYMRQPGSVELDAEFAFSACCQLTRILTENHSLSSEKRSWGREEEAAAAHKSSRGPFARRKAPAGKDDRIHTGKSLCR